LVIDRRLGLAQRHQLGDVTLEERTRLPGTECFVDVRIDARHCHLAEDIGRATFKSATYKPGEKSAPVNLNCHLGRAARGQHRDSLADIGEVAPRGRDLAECPAEAGVEDDDHLGGLRFVGQRENLRQSDAFVIPLSVGRDKEPIKPGRGTVSGEVQQGNFRFIAKQ